MKPTVKLASFKTPDGSDMSLHVHDGDYRITVGNHDLMLSRRHESELQLARLGCRHLTEARSPAVLIGGLGMGYTLRQALDLLPAGGRVTVAELLPEVIEWNRVHLGGLTGHPLDDPRVTVVADDVLKVLQGAARAYDAILLDVDNGPRAISAPGNARLYRREGIAACCRALTGAGCLAVWSAEPDKAYERALIAAGLRVRRYRAPAYKGSQTQSCFVWVAAMQARLLPPGGGELQDAPARHERRFGPPGAARPRGFVRNPAGYGPRVIGGAARSDSPAVK